MEPSIWDSELHTQYCIYAFKFSCAVGEFVHEHGVSARAQGDCVHVNWWVKNYEDNTQAVRFLLAMVREERESAVMSGM